MPLSEPRGGGFDPRILLADIDLRSDGPDSAVNFTAASYDAVKNQALIGGNNSFTGTMADIMAGKVAQYPTNPNTVITGGDVGDFYANNIDGGALVRIGNQFARTADDGASWTAITPGVSASYDGIQSWRESQIIYLHQRLSIPSRDYIISNDNGATFPFTTGFSGLANVGRQGIHKAGGDAMIIIHGQGPALAWSVSDDLTAAVWNSFDFAALLGALGVVQSLATNGDASHAVVSTNTGDIITSTDGLNSWTLFDRDLNPFQAGDNPAAGRDIEDVTFVPDLGGYFLTHRSIVGFFIPDDSSLNAGRTISYAMIGAVNPQPDSGLTDNANLLVPATNNSALRTLPSE